MKAVPLSMPPSRKNLIGPMRIQTPPTPVGPPRLVLAGQVVEPAGDLLAAADGLNAAGDVDADRQLAVLVQVVVEVERRRGRRCGRRCW